MLSEIVGVTFVLQHTPRAVTAAPPSDVIFPPHCTVVAVIAVIVSVVNTGTFASELTGSSSEQLAKRITYNAVSIKGKSILDFLSTITSCDFYRFCCLNDP